MSKNKEDEILIERWCKSAKLTPLEALTRLWLALDEHREFIDDVGFPARKRVRRVEEFAADCRRAYWREEMKNARWPSSPKKRSGYHVEGKR